MGNETPPTDDPATEIVGEGKLRGSALNGSEQKAAVDHSEFERQRNPGTELRLDGESDSLYGDGIDIDGPVCIVERQQSGRQHQACAQKGRARPIHTRAGKLADGDDCIGTNEDEDGCNICCVLLRCLELRRPLKQPKCGSRGEQDECGEPRCEQHLLPAPAEAGPRGITHQHELAK